MNDTNTVRATLADRIEQRMRELDVTQEDIANEVGTSQTTISRICRGETQRSKHIPKIAKMLGVSEQWLLFGDNGNADYKCEVETWANTDSLPSGMVAIPFYKEVEASAGNGSVVIKEDSQGRVLWFARSFFDKKGVSPNGVIALTIRGNSMEPHYKNGGTITISRDKTKVIDGELYAINYNGELFFKRLIRKPPNSLILKSDNPEYPEIEALIQDVIIIGRAISYSSEI